MSPLSQREPINQGFIAEQSCKSAMRRRDSSQTEILAYRRMQHRAVTRVTALLQTPLSGTQQQFGALALRQKAKIFDIHIITPCFKSY